VHARECGKIWERYFWEEEMTMCHSGSVGANAWEEITCKRKWPDEKEEGNYVGIINGKVSPKVTT
jgi:hypothetical protein